MKKSTLIIRIMSLIVLIGLCAGLYKVNQKINNLAERVMMSEGETEEEKLLPGLHPGNEGWMITQFGDVTQNQENFYTISTDHGLVILDGGYGYEVPQLRKVIAEYGNVVDAWILSHPHPDHMTAFLDIYDDPQGIEIRHIYSPNFPSIELMRKNASWDDFSTVERFYSESIPLEYLHVRDKLKLLDGLQIDVLSAYDDYVDECSNDLLNDGSLVLKVKGKEDTMLFCSDVGAKMTDYLIDTYGDELKVDYVQMGHHGTGGPAEAFYKIVQPKAAFFDAPAWLIKNEKKPSTKEKEILMKKQGALIFNYYTAPNQIILH